MSRLKCTNSISAGAPPQTPLGAHNAPPTGFEGREGEGMEGEKLHPC